MARCRNGGAPEDIGRASGARCASRATEASLKGESVTGIVSVDTLLFSVRHSVRYHSRRRAFFDTVNLAANAASVIFSSAAMAALLREDLKYLAPWIALTVTVISTLNLVLRSSERARAHHDLAKRFIALEQRVYPAPEDQLATLYAEKLAIEADEPPTLVILSVMCHNDQCRAEGLDSERQWNIRWWQRMFAHFMDLPPSPERLHPK